MVQIGTNRRILRGPIPSTEATHSANTEVTHSANSFGQGGILTTRVNIRSIYKLCLLRHKHTETVCEKA